MGFEWGILPKMDDDFFKPQNVTELDAENYLVATGLRVHFR